ncbi:sugar ABC transporter permease [Saccharopolyspora sp. K220]|uniref:carbohydrate ABC transporter permease n=1 Tax=Saccharopolyspora soli TaxID=2926618 RepID=UPI001F59214A|nr:sugar ABC transporter permease [Saccharopolyspora soli]MCI2417849.1 sugar ABC transporter permease [Saccharopolyspora soli]
MTSAVSRTGRAGQRLRRGAVGYLFVLPIVAFFVVFVGAPFVRSVYLSLTEWSGYGVPKFVGLGNFAEMVADPVFWRALATTVLFTAATTVLQTVVPLLVAVLVNKGWRAGVVFRTVLFIPAVISFVVTAVLWQLMYDPNVGVINEFLRAVGLGELAHAWLADPATVLPALVLVSLWRVLGLFMLIFLAGLQTIPTGLYEAARIDGATPVQQFRHVTVPMLRRVTAVVVTLNLIDGFKTFDLIYVMTGGGPNRASEVLGTYLYGLAFGSSAGAVPALGYATAISMVIFVLAMAATIVQLRLGRVRDVR